MLSIVKDLFGTKDLFKVLKISRKDATDKKKLHSSYLRAALVYHPDKGTDENREELTKKFQLVKQIYDILKDDDLRKSYEETGEWPDGDEFLIPASAFGNINQQDILDFQKKYKGSVEEREDIKKAYEEGKGDIFYIVDNIFLANILEDEERVQSIIADMIENGELTEMSSKKVSKKARDKKLQKAKKEAEESAAMKQELGLADGMDALKQAIATRGANRMDSLLAQLEQKYGSSEKRKCGKGTSKASDNGPSPSKRKRSK